MNIRGTIASLACAGTVLATACAVTDYDLITDNDQVSNGKGTGIVNTNGTAFIRNKNFVAMQWPDGTDNLLQYVDQTASGDRTITTYNNFSTGDEPIFAENLYCSPERQGCAIATADDPEVGDVDPFDYRLNPNCSGARSLSILMDSGRYYGECGRVVPSLGDRLSLLYMGTPMSRRGVAGLAWTLTPRTTTVHLDNLAGDRTLLPLTGEVGLTMLGNGTRRTTVDLTNPALKAMGDAFANWAQTRASHGNEIVVTYNGIEFRKTFGLVKEPGKKIRGFLNATY